MSARDAVRLGEFVAIGAAAGPKWTDWLLAEMRQVRGMGDFGIAEALPKSEADKVATKTGWHMHTFDNHWRINCLAVHPEWVLAVMTRYPERLGFAYGGKGCQDVARQAIASSI